MENDLRRRVAPRLKTGTNQGLAISEPARNSFSQKLSGPDRPVRGVRGKMEGAAAAPPHPPAAAAPGRPWSRRSGAPGCGDVSCARGCMAPAGSRGRPRPAAPYAPRPIPGSGAPAAPAPAHRPSARPPHPRPAAPVRPLTPGERGPAAPSRACPSRLAQRRGLRGPSIAQAPRSSLALSVCSLAGGARTRSLARSPHSSRSLPRTRPPTPARPTPVFIR